MKMVVWTFLLVLSPLLSGCFTFNEVSRSDGDYARLPDFVDRVEKASVTESNQLLIFVEARLANSSHRDLYTVTAPLSETQIYKGYNDIAVPYGRLGLPRSVISHGWGARQSTNADCKSVSIGSPVTWNNTQGSFTKYFHLKEKMQPDTAGTRALFLVIDTIDRTTDGFPFGPLEFVYVDTTRPEAFTILEVEQETLHPRYWLLPLTITGDLVTLPLQIPVFMLAIIFNPDRH